MLIHFVHQKFKNFHLRPFQYTVSICICVGRQRILIGYSVVEKQVLNVRILRFLMYKGYLVLVCSFKGLLLILKFVVQEDDAPLQEMCRLLEIDLGQMRRWLCHRKVHNRQIVDRKEIDIRQKRDRYQIEKRQILDRKEIYIRQKRYIYQIEKRQMKQI